MRAVSENDGGVRKMGLVVTVLLLAGIFVWSGRGATPSVSAGSPSKMSSNRMQKKDSDASPITKMNAELTIKANKDIDESGRVCGKKIENSPSTSVAVDATVVDGDKLTPMTSENLGGFNWDIVQAFDTESHYIFVSGDNDMISARKDDCVVDHLYKASPAGEIHPKSNGVPNDCHTKCTSWYGGAHPPMISGTHPGVNLPMYLCWTKVNGQGWNGGLNLKGTGHCESAWGYHGINGYDFLCYCQMGRRRIIDSTGKNCKDTCRDAGLYAFMTDAVGGVGMYLCTAKVDGYRGGWQMGDNNNCVIAWSHITITFPANRFRCVCF